MIIEINETDIYNNKNKKYIPQVEVYTDASITNDGSCIGVTFNVDEKQHSFHLKNINFKEKRLNTTNSLEILGILFGMKLSSNLEAPTIIYNDNINSISRMNQINTSDFTNKITQFVWLSNQNPKMCSTDYFTRMKFKIDRNTLGSFYDGYSFEEENYLIKKIDGVTEIIFSEHFVFDKYIKNIENNCLTFYDGLDFDLLLKQGLYKESTGRDFFNQLKMNLPNYSKKDYRHTNSSTDEILNSFLTTFKEKELSFNNFDFKDLIKEHIQLNEQKIMDRIKLKEENEKKKIEENRKKELLRKLNTAYTLVNQINSDNIKLNTKLGRTLSSEIIDLGFEKNISFFKCKKTNKFKIDKNKYLETKKVC